MSINTKLINKPNTTNQTDSLTGTSINKMSPDVAMRLCKIPIAIKVKKRPKYTSRPVNASASCTSTDKSEINRIAPTQKASTDRKSTRLNSSHVSISYAVFCLKKKKKTTSSISQTI